MSITIYTIELELRLKQLLKSKRFTQMPAKEQQQFSKWHYNHKLIVYTNNAYEKNVIFVCIREDGDTRTVFNGVINNISEFKTILSLVR